jgi:hypothetical protein
MIDVKLGRSFPMREELEQTGTGRPLELLAARAEQMPAVRKGDLRTGDWVVIVTKNSVYSLCVVGWGVFSVAGGWFDRHGLSPQKIGVNGCTFGGHAIKTDLVAAPGLFLEFDNRVTTTRIREARVFRGDAGAAVH